MNKLFKDNILTINIEVIGETDTYTVRISFGGFLDLLQEELARNNDTLELKVIIRALLTGFNRDNVYIGCNCPDFQYRYSYFATRNQITSIDPENRPSDITNPDDSLGSGCKHVLLVLSNNSWLRKVASVIHNYILYMEKHYFSMYTKFIYPAVYGKEYEEPVQQNMFDTDTLDSDSDLLDKSNEYGRTRTQFKKGNTQGVRYAPNDYGDEDDQLSFDDVTDDIVS